MLPRKSSLLFVSHVNSFCPLYYSQAPSPQSCRHTFAWQKRAYAQHVNPPSEPRQTDAGLLDWPAAVHPEKSPTPYQILRCKKGEAYTKHRFYALVKLYHPDRCLANSPVVGIPLSVRLERYRMLVAAHEILSDGEKRRAYDAFGVGWVGHQHTPTSHNPYNWEFDQKRWATDPRNNATWEDWERWYEENDSSKGAKERVLQMSNFTFMALLFAFVGVGGVMQGTRFNGAHNSVVERQNRVHREASIELQRSKHATMGGDRDERIRTFLEHREANLAGEESYHRLLPPVENCTPDDVRRH
jgi:curved DNA-binding protein CbpA